MTDRTLAPVTELDLELLTLTQYATTIAHHHLTPYVAAWVVQAIQTKHTLPNLMAHQHKLVAELLEMEAKRPLM